MQTNISVTEIAFFAGGCFWHIEESFRCLKGVIATKSGFMGGKTEKPSYEDVCTGNTGHTETVKITYNTEQITYKKLLTHFFEIHNPTQLNRQGPDIGTQYRSVIFYNNEQQQQQAIKFVEKLQNSGKYEKSIVTSIEPATTFWKAEEYHQKYLAKNGMQSCVI